MSCCILETSENGFSPVQATREARIGWPYRKPSHFPRVAVFSLVRPSRCPPDERGRPDAQGSRRRAFHVCLSTPAFLSLRESVCTDWMVGATCIGLLGNDLKLKEDICMRNSPSPSGRDSHRGCSDIRDRTDGSARHNKSQHKGVLLPARGPGKGQGTCCDTANAAATDRREPPTWLTEMVGDAEPI